MWYSFQNLWEQAHYFAQYPLLQLQLQSFGWKIGKKKGNKHSLSKLLCLHQQCSSGSCATSGGSLVSLLSAESAKLSGLVVNWTSQVGAPCTDSPSCADCRDWHFGIVFGSPRKMLACVHLASGPISVAFHCHRSAVNVVGPSPLCIFFMKVFWTHPGEFVEYPAVF